MFAVINPAEVTGNFGNLFDNDRNQRIETGTKLGPYEIVSLRRTGGMGEVYRAKDTSLVREVAGAARPLTSS